MYEELDHKDQSHVLYEEACQERVGSPPILKSSYIGLGITTMKEYLSAHRYQG